MRYTHIDIKGNTYTLTKTPNWVQKLFGYKEKKIEYIDDGYVFHHFCDITCFLNKKTGAVVDVLSIETKLLNDYKRKKRFNIT